MITLKKPRKKRITKGNVIPNSCGGANSAAKQAGKSGVKDLNSWWLWIPGEGKVLWSELRAQVSAAYDAWRIKRAMQGKTTWDGWEAIQSNIAEAQARKARKAQMLRAA